MVQRGIRVHLIQHLRFAEGWQEGVDGKWLTIQPTSNVTDDFTWTDRFLGVCALRICKGSNLAWTHSREQKCKRYYATEWRTQPEYRLPWFLDEPSSFWPIGYILWFACGVATVAFMVRMEEWGRQTNGREFEKDDERAPLWPPEEDIEGGSSVLHHDPEHPGMAIGVGDKEEAGFS